MKRLSLVLGLFLWISIGMAEIINVPGEYSTIQEGINAAEAGDTVLVAEDNYVENINFLGKAITVASMFIMDRDTSHISQTVIDGSSPTDPDSGSVVFFISGEDTTSVLCGFTITGGSGTKTVTPDFRVGGGIYLVGSGATICHNRIMNNIIDDVSVIQCLGGGISAGSPEIEPFLIIENNIIQNNICQNGNLWGNMGGGLCIYSNCRIDSNIIQYNQALSDGEPEAVGGGMLISMVDSVVISNNNFMYNKALTASTSWLGAGGGAYFWNCEDAKIQIKNNRFAYNEIKSSAIADGGGVSFENCTGEILFTNNLVYSNFYSDSETARGGGVYITVNSDVQLENNTIYGNNAVEGGGVCVYNNSIATLMNNIIWNNMAANGPGIYTQDGGTVTVTYTDIQNGWAGTGNRMVDPDFTDTEDFYLNEVSGCIDYGNPASEYNDPEDPMNPGYARLPSMGELRNDMGAYGGPNSNTIPSDIMVGINDELVQISQDFILFQNYPNPFNPSTMISYQLAVSGNVELSIYNLFGQIITVLVSKKQMAGTHQVEWDASGLASGIYFYRLKINNKQVLSKKMMLIR